MAALQQREGMEAEGTEDRKLNLVVNDCGRLRMKHQFIDVKNPTECFR